jgi:amidase
VAIAAGLAPLAVGTETDGSIVCPAAINGIVGIKPTVGLVSRGGIIPIAVSQDTAGPMARSVADAALLLQVLAGFDPSDSAMAAESSREPPDYSASLRRDGLRGARIGIARSLAGFHDRVDVLFEASVELLKAEGATIVDPANPQFPDTLRDDEFTVLLYEFKDGIERYLAARDGGPKTLADLVAFNEREREREMPHFGQELFVMSQSKGPLTDAAYREAKDRAQRAAREGLDSILGKNRLDAIVAPTEGPAWLTDLVNGDPGYGGGQASRAPAVAGYPHVTVPMGEVSGLPVGISFIGTAFSEATLIRLAYAYEQARRESAVGAAAR